ncbi:hypothetical protein BCR42DRAFT_418004 [Absidia repens]|uniref:Uncharacterized protein n=1 Tax=Absidia repens TaxID=90262 RepID=A0A1X2ICQ1_9FUNG|nr:hypothetical protein BCR42DRAFT_418004 [Absidia repens]
MKNYWNGKRQQSRSSKGRAKKSSFAESSTSTVQTRSQTLRLKKLKRSSPNKETETATSPSPPCIPKYEDESHQMDSSVLNDPHLERHYRNTLVTYSRPQRRRTPSISSKFTTRRYSPPIQEQPSEDTNRTNDDSITANKATVGTSARGRQRYGNNNNNNNSSSSSSSSSGINGSGRGIINNRLATIKQGHVETTPYFLRSSSSSTRCSSEDDYRPNHVSFEGNNVKISDNFRDDWNWEVEVKKIEKAKVKIHDDMYLASFYLVLRW